MSIGPMRVKKPFSMVFRPLCDDILQCQGSVSSPINPVPIFASSVSDRIDSLIPTSTSGPEIPGFFDFLFGRRRENRDQADRDSNGDQTQDFVGFLVVAGLLAGAVIIAMRAR
jgi:hypothetical protein